MQTAVTGLDAGDIVYGMSRLGRDAAALEPGAVLTHGSVSVAVDNPDLIEVMERTGPLGLIHIGPEDPKAMLYYAEQCRDLGLEFSADPAGLEGDEAAEFISGAKFLVTGQAEYEFLKASAGLDEDEVLSKVRVRITTLDQDGIEIAGHDMDRVHVPVARAREVIDPAGATAAFKAGLLSALGWGMPLRRAAEIGGQLTTVALESVGTTGYSINSVEFVRRLEESYGPACAAEASAYLLPE
ncbi:PfkB family carbohydrate kinase [Glycomyces salinus]|uniref:PfkB family carbohydrate kinase n=1 Tax=Glycomyces salinus TaxID=980294 RepID=UPI0018EB8A68|nr:PfkB family carbohydrate kinase [Glycomyces salinus]